ncbi:hypothetical protein A5710_17780 [Mycolicibacter sinensis]|uniref:Uncharacterized protein n=2 Tax=Mycolicibacter sinensis (strain JDM601) TaxID=875328 RepID=A0A1A2NIF7_MYCSD|nr:hypothetical protein A5694_11175 [Mycolicibacter sinensis]OBI31599.1 hypothetical protein A5710_17780 [Mycolicibacter sinensis]
MGRMRTPTAVNRHAAGEIQKQVANDLLTVYSDALKRMRALSQSDPQAVTAKQAVAALRELRRWKKTIEKLQFDLLGASILAGGTVSFITSDNERIGPRASTLTRRLPHTPAGMIGREIVWDPSVEWNWRVVE